MSGETEQAVSGWTVDTLRESIQRQLDDQRRMLDERYATQTKALDAAFKAAEQAVQTALVSAEKAVNKAEQAAENRFTAVNEFRGQLADQASTFATRVEMNALLTAQGEKIDAEALRTADRFREIQTRLDRTSGRSSGRQADWALLVGIMVVIGVVAGVIGHFVS